MNEGEEEGEGWMKAAWEEETEGSEIENKTERRAD